MEKNSLLLAATLFCLSIGTVNAYNWQKHVPSETSNWQKHVPDEATEVYDWRKHVPGWAPSDTPKNGNVQSTHYGPTSLSNQNIQHGLSVHGPLDIENSSVNGLVHVYGPFSTHRSSFTRIEVSGPINASDVRFDSLDIDGMAKLQRVNASGLISIRGYLDADDSRLRDIVAYSSEMLLHDTDADRIVIKEQNSSKRQIVRLTGRTRVGSIVFESGNGEVIAGPDATYNFR